MNSCAKSFRLVCGRAHMPTSLRPSQLASRSIYCCETAQSALLTSETFHTLLSDVEKALRASEAYAARCRSIAYVASSARMSTESVLLTASQPSRHTRLYLQLYHLHNIASLMSVMWNITAVMHSTEGAGSSGASSRGSRSGFLRAVALGAPSRRGK